MKDFDFSGWATRNDLRCADGRVIRRDAFKDNDGSTVPLVWNHQHNKPENILGHALLENRPEGVYAYGWFNDTEAGQNAKILVQSGDVKALSIYANQLKQHGGDVTHGAIREVSLVLAGANPGAFIDSIIKHGEESDEEAVIYTNEEISLAHAEEISEDDEIAHAEEKTEEAEVADEKKVPEEQGETIGDVYDTLTEKQKLAVDAMIGLALQSGNSNTEKDDADMKHNIFEADETTGGEYLSHAEMAEVIGDFKKYGSMKETFIAHGIEDIEVLFPEAKNLNNPPEWIRRPDGWVKHVMGKVKKSPFSRVKGMWADLTEDQARAKGYIKGKLKKEQVFSLLKRSTDPQTVYKKQRLDRDDVLDITDFSVVSWVKTEMRFQLDEEFARAFLIGDGRPESDDDKIHEHHIRPVMNDADLFVIRWAVAGANASDKAKNFIRATIKARKNYKGSGNPDLYTTEDMLTDMLLIEDGIGHRLYKTVAELATALRVNEIVTVPVMEGVTDKDEKEVYGIIVNLADYTVGADKGGEVSFFDDFDIDYNAMKYLIEARCSGALTKPFSAIVLREGTETKSEEPTMVDAIDEFRTRKHNVPNVPSEEDGE